MTAEEHIAAALKLMRADLDNDHLKDTPKRVAKHWRTIFGPRLAHEDFLRSLTTFPAPKQSQLILVDTISFNAHCAHHLLPYFGYVNVGYIPNNKKLVGLSKFGRIVDYLAQPPGVQEELTIEIAEMIKALLDPLFLGIVIRAKHTCMMCRGVEKLESVTTTSYFSPSTQDTTKDEFFRLVNLKTL